MAAGKMQKRKCRDGSYRLRFYHAHDDQVEIIEHALKRASEAMGTEFDVVALEAICINYLSGGNVNQ